MSRVSTTADHELIRSTASRSGGAEFDVAALSEWTQLHHRVSDFHSRRDVEWTAILREVLQQAASTLDVSLPRLRDLLHTFWTQPAQACIPHLRNRLGYNIDDYTQQMRTLLTQVQQQEARYNRALKQKLGQPF